MRFTDKIGTAAALLTTLVLLIETEVGESRFLGQDRTTSVAGHKQQRLVFVDSDGGSDDLLSVMQLVRDPSIRLLGIGCVYGNVKRDQACANILRTLNYIDRTDIPVYPGCDSPILTEASFDGWFGPDGMGNSSGSYSLPANTNVSDKHAVTAMMEAVAEYPGQVTLLSLGPLTNLAVALKLDPDFSFRLKDQVVMGGTMNDIGNSSPVAEFNFYDDAEAAAVVFLRAGFPIRVVSYELCLVAGPTWDVFNEWVSTDTKAAVFLNDIYNLTNTRARQKGITMYQPCDLLATTVMLAGDDVIVGSTLRTAQVESCGQITRGELVVDYRTTSTPQSANIDLIVALRLDQVIDIWQRLFTS